MTEYENRASLFEAIGRGMHDYFTQRVGCNTKPLLGEFWKLAAEWAVEMSAEHRFTAFSNARALERAFKEYIKEGYKSILHKNLGNDAARRVSVMTERLLVSLYGHPDKPFIETVHKQYTEFIHGTQEYFDRNTGEVFHPEDFRYVPEGGGEARPLDLSPATVRNYLKNAMNQASIKEKTDGRFEYVNAFSPKHIRGHGRYTLSKVTMDDVTLSRKSREGWVNKYVATDVVSGYIFRPEYVAGRPNRGTVLETVRNMVRELTGFGIGFHPYEGDVEYFLIKDIEWFPRFYSVVTYNNSATSKHQEHFNRQLKYGISKEEGHMKNRHYGKGAYKGIRQKEAGEFVEEEYDFETLRRDDLHDIELWNNSLHPLQKTWPGMTRKQVLLSQVNPNLVPFEPRLLYRDIGIRTETTIRHNNDLQVNYRTFWLKSYDSLSRLKPNIYGVTAYYLPDFDGNTETAYLYQGDRYIGEAINMENKRYNTCRAEWTPEDEANYLFQNKQVAKFHKAVKDGKANLLNIGVQKASVSREIEQVEVEVVETAPAVAENDYEDVLNRDWGKAGFNGV
jgi:hypothetical protein